MVKFLGGAAVAMPQNDTYEALQKGVVEGTFAPIETLKGWRQAEVVKYTTECTDVGYTTSMFVVMNVDKWNALPNDLKEMIEGVSEEWVDVHGAAWDKSDAEGRAYTLSEGNSIIALSEEENQRWAKAVSPVIEDYIKTTEEKGLTGKKAVATVKELLTKYSE
ncbi:MAG: hypothetical protein U9N38_04155 [Thermodesulfobacteriota bacterium]|nr:hypothetical protein [Thermodesulfobacteriota bacterium]